jgi:hypothetical protein
MSHLTVSFKLGIIVGRGERYVHVQEEVGVWGISSVRNMEIPMYDNINQLLLRLGEAWKVTSRFWREWRNPLG